MEAAWLKIVFPADAGKTTAARVITIADLFRR
jgi:hypothetical protein